MTAAFTEEWYADYRARTSFAATAKPAKAVSIPPVPEGQNTISLALSAPPSVNDMFANVPGVGRVKTGKYRKWFKVARQEAIIGMMGKTRIRGPFKATLYVAADGDLDNRVKATIDLCVAIGAVVDDIHLAELHVYRQTGTKGIWIVLEPSSVDVRSAASP